MQMLFRRPLVKTFSFVDQNCQMVLVLQEYNFKIITKCTYFFIVFLSFILNNVNNIFGEKTKFTNFGEDVVLNCCKAKTFKAS